MTETYKDTHFRVFALNSNRPLAEEIAKEIGVSLGKAEITRFEDGEIRINIEESIRGSDIYLVQSTNHPSNEYLMELLIMTDALRRASAKTINAVIPYYGYARQDRKARPRESITAKLVANMLTTAGVDRVVTLELHSPQIQGFFDIPVDHLSATALLANHLLEHQLADHQTVVVSPDHAGVTRVREMAHLLDAPLAIIDKRSSEFDEKADLRVIGDVEGKTCVLFDDLIDTGDTMIQACRTLKKAGATDVYACATHPVLSGSAIEKLEQSGLKKIIVTNTIDLSRKKSSTLIEQISVAGLLGDALKRIHEHKSVKPLFDRTYVGTLDKIEQEEKTPDP